MARLGTWTDARRVLTETFRYPDFRPGQSEAIRAAMQGRDAVVVLPTGRGKSLCYQVPALVAATKGRGATVVVSPLIALMQDQVAQLRGRGISAGALHSQLDADEARQTLAKLHDGELALVYVSPERAATASFRRHVVDSPIAMLAIDEAHCVSQWGHDFRPDYLRLGEIREVLDVPTLALTATATPRVVAEIQSRLGLRDPTMVTGDFRRPNLRFCVRHPPTAAARLAITCAELAAAGLHGRRGPGRGIVYCSTRKAVQTVAAALRREGFAAGYYHAGRTALARTRAQDGFVAGRTRVLVATNAFGMGIDVPDIRAIVHYQTPGSLEAYYQEAGRAGRDGQPSCCAMLFGAADMVTQRRLASLSDGGMAQQQRREEALAIIERYARASTCRQVAMCEHFTGHDDHAPCGGCDVCDPHSDDEASAIERAPAPVVAPLPDTAKEVIVAAVGRLARPVGKRNLARALRGSKAKTLARGGLLTMPEYGTLSEHDEDSLVAAVDELVQSGRLVRRGRKYPTVWTPGKPIRGVADETTTPARRRRSTRGVEGSIAPELDRYRKRMAGKLRWKAYMVFQRKAILAIDRARPTTLAELARIPGLGPAKIDRFGEDILELVRRYSRPA